jgi:predicted Fe-Mo cluster-binding NifX family protein
MIEFNFVLASDNGLQLSKGHFGDSEQFHFYKVSENGEILKVKSIKNSIKDIDETTKHGSIEKRQSLISYLGGDVDFIIASRMSPNFKQINNKTKVCPVVSNIKNIEDLLSFISGNVKMFKDLVLAKKENREVEILIIKAKL